ncbi:chemotaxis protein CheW [Sphingomonas panacis]|uniref:Chemotaxis protein CheW n=1 Tax=Sphingomonas panacis TaxID=1560345 RepID=A0A1B3ZDJ8_9SPHN|nr:chemotaxis protein CheW [Sphingomonas panacis]AOH85487.1 chemotaxis protein CheW [Sphingomonas panacis]
MTGLFLIAQLAGRTVAIDSAQVESVVDIGTIVPVPRAGAQVRGLAALRSRVVTVIDPGAVLGEGVSVSDRAVIVVVDGHHYAVLVDALEDIAPFDIRPLASGVILDGVWSRVGCGTIELDGAPILAIDARALVPGALPVAA